MFTLNFTSEMTQSRYPVSRNHTELTFAKVRKTTLVFEKLNEENKPTQRKVVEVVCHPGENDIPALGQKYAVATLTKQFKSKAIRKEIWNEFAKHSKAASRIMGLE